MQKKFELWLDESGQFFKERDKKRENMLPSLIGGFLVPAEEVESVLAEVAVDEDRNHAMYLNGNEKREYVLPLLQTLVHERGLSMVFFENTRYEDAPSNRQLYLHMMAEGLLQLLQKLDGLYESVDLAVWIAQRKDVHHPNPDRQRIAEAEYIAMLNRVLEQKRLQRRILLSDGTRIHFVIRPAHREQRLQCADFACNTRLTRFSEAFAEVREEVDKLYETAHFFDLHESSSANYIRICMEKGDVADAIMELFSTWETIDRQQQLDYIVQGMKSYAKHQREVVFSQCLAEIEAYLYHQDDYELGQTFLESLHNELVPKLKEQELLTPFFDFRVQLLLIEQSIKMGELQKARLLVEQCKVHLRENAHNKREVWGLFSKEALLLLREGEGLQAELLMEKVCHSTKREQEMLWEDAFFAEQKIAPVSEDYLKACSLYIYILLCKDDAGSYQKLFDLLEQVMNPKDAGYERLCRYRSLVEAREGHIVDALRWLLMTEELEEQNLEKRLELFLEDLQLRKDSRDIQFGVLYYLSIAEKAILYNHRIADLMCRVLEKEGRLLEYLGLKSTEDSLPNAIDVSSVFAGESKRRYYPMEEICELREKLKRK